MTKSPLLPLKFFLFFGHAINTMVISFLPVYFGHNGFTSSQIGWFLAIGPLMGLFAQPVWGYASDKFQTVKKILLVCLIGVLISVMWLFQIDQFIWLLAAGTLFFFFFTPVIPFSDSLAKRTAYVQKVTFGSIRTWGSLGFAVISLLVGWLLNKIGIGYLAIPVIAFTLITCVLSLVLKDIPSSGDKIDYKKASRLFKKPALVVFLIVVSLVTLTHRTSDSFISLYLMELNGNEMQVGWIWFVGVSSEALLFFLSTYWFREQHAVKYLIFAAFLYAIRWVLTALAPDPATLLMIQVLHGVCFAIILVASLEYLYRIVPPEMQATGHMMYVAISFGVTGIIGSSLGGMVFEAFGGSTLYLLLSGIALIGGIGLIISYRFLKQAKPITPDSLN